MAWFRWVVGGGGGGGGAWPKRVASLVNSSGSEINDKRQTADVELLSHTLWPMYDLHVREY